jgi:biopolymer transport protein TolQ
MSFVGLVFGSGIYATIILSILAFMSFVVWGVIIIKVKYYQTLKVQNRRFAKDFDHIKQFHQMAALVQQHNDGPLVEVSQSVMVEAGQLSPYVSYDSIHHRASLLEEAIQRSVEAHKIEEERLLAFLAMTSSLAPFLGLLGTVWGIMTSFFEIGAQGSAELSVVAPGIAAALVTTIAGLIVAIPASASYNIFVSRNNKNEVYYYNFGSHLLTLFKRGDLQALEKTEAPQ